MIRQVDQPIEQLAMLRRDVLLVVVVPGVAAEVVAVRHRHFVDGPGDHLLAGASLSLDEYGCTRGRDVPHGIHQVLPGSTRSLHQVIGCH